MHKRLGEILVAEGLIDAPRLQAALAEAALYGQRVGEILVARGICTEEAILNALATQLGVDPAPLSTTVMIPPRVLKLLPGEFARERQVLPLFLDRGTGLVEVAMSDPADLELLDELRFRTGCQIRPLVALASELSEAIDRFYYGQATPPPVERPLRVSMAPSDGQLLADAPPKATEQALQAQLNSALSLLKEVSAAHQVLLGLLEDRGLVNHEQYDRRLRAELARLRD